MNWIDQLKQFRDENPDLPQGPDTPADNAPDLALQQRARLDISIERKGRAGKTATLVTGWQLPDERLLEIAATLKKRLGTGGSARGGDILIQGDRRRELSHILAEMGFKNRII